MKPRIKQDKEGMVAVLNCPALLDRFNGTQCVQFAQVINTGELGIREKHIDIENGLEQEKQQTAAPLPAGKGTETHDRITQLGFPV